MKYLIFGATCEIGKHLINTIIENDSEPDLFLSSSSELKLNDIKKLSFKKKKLNQNIFM